MVTHLNPPPVLCIMGVKLLRDISIKFVHSRMIFIFIFSYLAVGFSSIKKLYYIIDDSACGLRSGYLIHQHIHAASVIIIDRRYNTVVYSTKIIFRKDIVVQKEIM